MKLRLLSVVAHVLLGILIFSSSSFAQRDGDGYHYNPKDCPLNIQSSKGIWSNPGRGEQHWGIQIDFNNTSDKKIVAIIFRVYGFSCFNDLTDVLYVIHERQNLTPGRRASKKMFLWADPDGREFFNNSDAAFHTIVITEELLFEDKTIWTRTDESYKDFIVETMAPKIRHEDLIDPPRENWLVSIF